MGEPLAAGLPRERGLESIEHYAENGYAIVPGVIAREQIERYLSRAREIVLGDHPPEAARRIIRDIRFAKGLLPPPEDPELALWKLLNPDRFDALFAEAPRTPKLLDAVSRVLGDDLLAFLLMLIYKPPGIAEAIHPFHQDAAFFPFGPHDSVAGVWIALDPADGDRGGLCVVPGSHRDPVRRHVALPGVNAGALAAEGVEGDPAMHARAIDVVLAPGDAAIFHSRLLHRTAGNRTREHRRAITLHVASARCRATGPTHDEFAFVLVRGRTYPGCLRPLESPPVELGARRRA